jgi:hypothetical protein
VTVAVPTLELSFFIMVSRPQQKSAGGKYRAYGKGCSMLQLNCGQRAGILKIAPVEVIIPC